MEGWNASPFTSSIVTVTSFPAPSFAVAVPNVVPITVYSPVSRSIEPSLFWSAPNSSPSARRARDSMELDDGLADWSYAPTASEFVAGSKSSRVRMKISSSLWSLLM